MTATMTRPPAATSLNWEEFGQYIRTRRAVVGISQRQLGRLTKTDQNAIYEIETAKRQPTIETCARIAAALDITLPTLLSRLEE